MDSLQPWLLRIPNEILLNIVLPLSIPDLRHLAQVSRRLHSFVEDYLNRYHYNTGLVALPNEIILTIAKQVLSQKCRSRLARASFKFYPLIMDYVLRYDVQRHGSSLLFFAAKRNHVAMARRILDRGGNLNALSKFAYNSKYYQFTPLAKASLHGHERMVRMLLRNGASRSVDGMRLPLAAAIWKKHENVALILSEELDSVHTPLLSGSDTAALQMASEAKLVNLVRCYLENESQANVRSTNGLSTALCRVLRQDISNDEFLKRELHEDTYQIVVMLLEHGANADSARIESIMLPSSVTARDLASRHPDPRVRLLLPKLRTSTRPRELDLQIGRPWMDLSQDRSFQIYGPQSKVHLTKTSDFVALSQYLEEFRSEFMLLTDEQPTISDAPNILVSEGVQHVQETPMPTEPPPLSSFPQLGIPNPSLRHASGIFWANKPTETFQSADPAQMRSIPSATTISMKAKQSESSAVVEAFPPLGRHGFVSNDDGKELWSRLAKENASQNLKELQPTPKRSENNIIGRSVDKRSKKKWQPLRI